MTSSPLDPRVEHLLRELAPQVLGTVVRRFCDFSASEDAVQEAMIVAAERWSRDGLPAYPRSWLIQVALRRMTDHIRREVARRNRETAEVAATPIIIAPSIYSEPERETDDTLVLLFMCCHPALSPNSAIAVTLRAVGGLTTSEIAQAFLVPEATMAQRISRAKQSIKTSRIPFRMPDETERAQRLTSVLHILYLIFNEGYTTSSGSRLHRTDLSNEAIRLVRTVHQLLPDNGEVKGLLALMLLTDARRSARTGTHGDLIPLDEQDRTRWDRLAIAEGVNLVSTALSKGSIGEYQLQAAIAAVHDEAPRAEDTDWPQIVALYRILMSLSDSPLVKLNHAVAIAMVNGPDAGLTVLKSLDHDERLRDSHRLDAARAHLLERAGQKESAIALYHAAAAKTASIPEKNYLIMRAARLRG